MKPCSKCGVPKDLSNFGTHKGAKDGHRTYCKLCKSQVDKKWGEANKGRLKENRRKYREANPEYHKEYYEANKTRVLKQKKKYNGINKDRIAQLNKKWQKANPDKSRSRNARRRSVKLQAHPPWAATLEKRQIEEIYTLARMQSQATGKEYHVDHIHPLQSPKEVMFEGEMIPLICGLHVPANLQILEASVNLSKGNKFEPYIESECDFTEPWQVRIDDRTQTHRSIDPEPLASKTLEPFARDGYTDQTSIDRISTHNISTHQTRKPKAVPEGQLALF